MAVWSIIATMFGCGNAKAPPQAPNSQFVAGQEWKYNTRSVEPKSRVVIGKITEVDNAGTVIHVKLTGLKINNPGAPGGFSTIMTHAPITEEKFKESVTELVAASGDLDGFEEGYDTWLADHRAGNAGVFMITLSEITECMEVALKNGRPVE